MDNEKKPRLALLDTLRGLTLVSMICYHGVWDLVSLGLLDWGWYQARPGWLWQQSICWVFILLSGFCWSLGRRPLKRGLTVFGAGLLVTLVTCVAVPEQRVLVGVLTFLGSAMVLLVPVRPYLEKLPPAAGAAGSAALFALCQFWKLGTLNFDRQLTAWLPEWLQESLTAAWLGVPGRHFWSTDYFSMLPWIFLFLLGWYLYRLLERRKRIEQWFARGNVPVLSWLGRHSLLVYLAHQPILWGLAQLLACGLP